jgi:DNA (cytosine-5)-methyltransferase 1
MNYISICSGIEAASVAWHNLGWKPLAFSEIEKFPSAVLAHHWPDVPNLGDMTKYNDWPTIKPELVVGGTPCQAFSIAGLRKGLADPRGNLTLTFLGILEKYRPKWVVWENVPGVLSDKTGAFGSFLSGLSELGYGWAYRILDAQHFGVPQRRRRVFVVGCIGSWASAAAVLFECQSLRWNPAKGRKTRQVSSTSSSPSSSGGSIETGRGCDIGLISNSWPAKTACTLNAAFGKKLGLEDQHINGGATLFVPALRDTVSTLTARGPYSLGIPEVNGGQIVPMIANAITASMGGSPTGHNREDNFIVSHSVGRPCEGTVIKTKMFVRRLTPRECERLQGFPDDHTLIPWRGKPDYQCPDSVRYKALGNSMAVPVMRWIGERIQHIQNIQNSTL